MDSGDTSAVFATYLAMAAVDGIAVRTSWAALEPSQGSYDWSAIDAAIGAAAARGKKIGLHVIGSVYAPPPAWLRARTYSYTGPNGAVAADPLPWDSTFLSAWATFAAALGAHLQSAGGASRIAYVSIAVPAPEMSLPGCANGVMGSTIAYDRSQYRSAWLSAIGTAQSAFGWTQKLLPVPVATICRPDSDGPALYLDLFGAALAQDAHGFASYATDLDTSGSVRMNGVASAAAQAPVVFQFIGAQQASLKSAVCAGLKTWHATLFEVYKSDLSSTDAATASGVAAIHAAGACT
jgi:hypothetical protein